ncbi:MAG: hypothetical protein LBU87_01160 [Lactobacillales bacterium]|jgi:hypothetical protein|nr:hypothetical protein [Lactobacillales bacterium]
MPVKKKSCTPKNYVKKVIEIDKKIKVKSPLATGYIPIDFLINRIHGIGHFNKGFTAGSKAVSLQKAYEEVCKNKK